MAPLATLIEHELDYYTPTSPLCVEPLTTPLKQNNKGVSFAQTDIVHEVLHLSDYSEEEIESSWYNNFEMRAIRKEVKSLVSRLNNNEIFTESNEFSTLRTRTISFCRMLPLNRFKLSC